MEKYILIIITLLSVISFSYLFAKCIISSENQVKQLKEEHEKFQNMCDELIKWVNEG